MHAAGPQDLRSTLTWIMVSSSPGTGDGGYIFQGHLTGVINGKEGLPQLYSSKTSWPPTWSGNVEGCIFPHSTDFPACMRHRCAPRCGRSSSPSGDHSNVSASAPQANLKRRHKSQFMWTVKTIRWEHFNGILPSAVCAKPRPPTASAATQSHINPRLTTPIIVTLQLAHT